MSTPGIAILGLDHWYAALSLAETAAKSEQVRLVGIAHSDEARAQQAAADHGAEVATSDYHSILERRDVDIVISMYSTDRNVEVCQAAAAAGKHIIAVKPMAMDLAGADAIVSAVRQAGVTYLPFESTYRLTAEWRRIKGWIDEGRIGRPVRYTHALHSSLPQSWPGASDSGWWVDPRRVPGGAWLDHAIYAVDLVRWMFGAEPISVHGTVANRRHKQLPVEDYGLATYELSNEAVAVIEDTWTTERGFFFVRSEVVGSAGAIFDDSRTTGRVALRGDFGFDGWTALEQQRPSQGEMIGHMLECLRGDAQPVASVEDARANLAACLAFYQAAREGRTVEI
jgi:predicted dehydrogenase